MENIIQVNSVEQYKKDMARYSIETNRRRAFPDYKDGLKLVHRRTLHAMASDLHLVKQNKFVKTAKVTGQVMGTYHPHGDTSIANAIKPLANWFETYMPLITSESNMGSMQGDGAAAQRYTEVTLSQFAKDVLFRDLVETKDIVDWVPNYSNDAMEPEYLPAALPLLLINGTYGIGTGKSTSLPPHNINEVIDATLTLIKNPNAQIVLIPDQCMKCQIIDTNWKQICNTGKGSFKVRAIIDIEIMNKGKANEHPALVIKSSPDMVFIDKGNAENGGVEYVIYDLIDKGKLPQITRIDEDSHGRDMRFVIHLKKGSDPNYVREFLYKSTLLEDTKSINFEVLDGINLIRMSYKSYLLAFIELRKMTKFRFNCIKLQDVKTKYHEREMYVKVIESGKIDEIIRRIRNSDRLTEEDNVNWLVSTLKITDLQAKFILKTPIMYLSKARLAQYKNDMAEFKQKESYYENKILNEDIIVQEIVDELLYFKKKYGKPRNCTIISKSTILDIPPGEFNIVITENNYIKKLAITDPIGAYRGDNPIKILKVDNREDIILISSSGRMFKLPVSKLPVTDKNSPGIDIKSIIKGLTSDIVSVLYLPFIQWQAKLKELHYGVLCTENNYIKKVDLNDVINATPSGIILTKLNDGDKVKDFITAPNNLDIIIYSKRKALRCTIDEIPIYKRNSLGVFAMNTQDPIDGISVISPTATDIVVVTESGKINRFDISGLAKSQRYKAGSSVIKLSKGDSINALFGVKDSDVLNVITRSSKYQIPVKDIPIMSSISTGSKLIPMKADNIVKVTVN